MIYAGTTHFSFYGIRNTLLLQPAVLRQNTDMIFAVFPVKKTHLINVTPTDPIGHFPDSKQNPDIDKIIDIIYHPVCIQGILNHI